MIRHTRPAAPVKQFEARDFMRKGDESLETYLTRLEARDIVNGNVQFAASYQLGVAHVAEMFETTEAEIIRLVEQLKESAKSA